MTKFKNMIGMGAATLAIISLPALATTTSTAAKPITAHAAKPAATHTVHTKAIAAAPLRAAPAVRLAPRVAAARPNGRMVQARLSNGKIVTFNCSLAGNQSKQACRS